MLTDNQVILEALEKATPGPWSLGYQDSEEAFVNAGKYCVAKSDGIDHIANAHLIANAPEWLRTKCNEVEALKAALSKYGQHLNTCLIKTHGPELHSCSCGLNEVVTTTGKA